MFQLGDIVEYIGNPGPIIPGTKGTVVAINTPDTIVEFDIGRFPFRNHELKLIGSQGGGWVITIPSAIDHINIRINLDEECECGSKNPVGHGHSSWCKNYRKEIT